MARRHAAFTRALLRRAWRRERGGVEKQLGAMEGKRRFGALVRVQVGLAETVAAASGCEVVERTVEPVAAEEPVERVARARPVLRLARHDERGEFGLDECGRVERLLVTLAGRGLVAVASVMTGQAKHAVVEAALVAEPCERLEPEGDVGGRRSADPPTMSACESRALS